MASSKLMVVCAVLAALSASASAGFFDLYPTIMLEHYNFSSSKESYRFNLEEPNGSKREEVGMILNPGTPEEELVVMGTYSVYDEKTETETITMYTADKDGVKSRYMLKNRKLSLSSLKTMAG